MKRFNKSLTAIACLIFLVNACADNREIIGSVYPVAETDFIIMAQSRMEKKFNEGDFLQSQKTAMQSAADRPPSVLGLSSILTTRQHWIDPSITVPMDVRDRNGHLILAAGSRWNPLTQYTWTKTLIFFDADNPAQMTWLERQEPWLNHQALLILVNGSVGEATHHFKQHVYFDQRGRLVQRLRINHVPAIVRQDGQRLRITEVKV